MKPRYSVSLMCLLALCLAPSIRGQEQSRGLVVELAALQKGSPIRIDSVASASEALFVNAKVTNIGAKPIARLDFGVLIRSSRAAQGTPALVSLDPVNVSLMPQKTAIVPLTGFQVSDIGTYNSQFGGRVVGEFGVLSVVFQDGTSWSDDPVRRGTFSVGRYAASRIAACKTQPNSPIVRVGLRQYPTFYCAETENCTQCSATTSSCTVSTCAQPNNPCPQGGPRQTCATR